MTSNQDQAGGGGKKEMLSSTATRQFGGLLGGTGDGRLKKNLHLASVSIQAATSNETSSDLLDRLKSFLPQMAKANETLSFESSRSAEGVEILPVGGESSEENEESSEDEEDSDESSAQSAKVEMNISLFPIDGEDDNNDVNANGKNITNHNLDLDVKRVRKSKVEEVD